jgi:hypothetical protein
VLHSGSLCRLHRVTATLAVLKSSPPRWTLRCTRHPAMRILGYTWAEPGLNHRVSIPVVDGLFPSDSGVSECTTVWPEASLWGWPRAAMEAGPSAEVAPPP